MIRRRAIEPSALGRRRRRRRNLKLIFWVLAILVLFGVIVFLSHLSKINVSDIQVNGNVFASSNNIFLLAKENLSGSYYHLFPKSNILLYPKGQLKANILQQFPPVKTVDISSNTFSSIKINLTERKPVALWCNDSNNCFFMDEDGFIFYVAPSYSTNLYFIYSGLISADNPLGQNYLSRDRFHSMSEFIDDVKKLNLTPTSLKATDPSDFELSLNPSGKIRFNTTIALSQTLSNLATIIDQNNPPDERLDLSQIDYIDLRFGNKIYYKLKGGAAATSTI
jgi:cell division septal protein FtsQ